MQNDLEDRTAKFGEDVIKFCKKDKADHITRTLINQIVRSATSVGANYMEARGACSRKDFKNKIFICKKELQETKHWIKMLRVAIPGRKEEIDVIYNECHELTLIFSKIAGTLTTNN